MRIAILTIGTQGDLDLFLGLGQALQKNGAEVVVGTSVFYAERVRAAGLMATGWERYICGAKRADPRDGHGDGFA